MKWVKSFLSAFLAATLLFAGCASVNTGEMQTAPVTTATTPDDTDPKMRFKDNEVVLLIEPEYNFKEYTLEDFSEVNCIKLTQMDCDILEGQLCRIMKLTLGIHSKEYVLSAVELLNQREDIHVADPNYIFDWVLDSSHATNENNEQWAIEKIALPAAWNISTGSSLISVGIIDAGVDSSHPDLENRINEALSRYFGPYSYSPLEDPIGHGTAVAGIIGGLWNNSGVKGVCQNVELVSLRINLGDETFGSLISAIEYANSTGIEILNCSMGVYNYSGDVSLLESAIRNYSGLFVCSAGNNGLDNDNANNIHYPSNFDLHNLIAVAASTESDQRLVVSNGASSYGRTTVDLFAPGDGIVTCYPNDLCVFDSVDDEEKHFSDRYHYASGTSVAAPYVTGVAALLLSEYGNMHPCEIKDTILSNVDDCGTAFDGECVSNGRLNAYKALSNPIRHTATYGASTGSKGHSGTCSCGYTFVASHEYTTSQYTPQKHKLTCSVCGHISYEAHKWSIGGNRCLSCGFNTEGSLMPRSLNTNSTEQHCLQ